MLWLIRGTLRWCFACIFFICICTCVCLYVCGEINTSCNSCCQASQVARSSAADHYMDPAGIPRVVVTFRRRLSCCLVCRCAVLRSQAAKSPQNGMPLLSRVTLSPPPQMTGSSARETHWQMRRTATASREHN